MKNLALNSGKFETPVYRNRFRDIPDLCRKCSNSETVFSIKKIELLFMNKEFCEKF